MTRVSTAAMAALVLGLVATPALAQKAPTGGGGAAPAAPAAPTAAVEACPQNMTEYRGSGSMITCSCDAAAMSGSVWGTDTYTDDSSVCAAAQHAGVLGPEGGTITAQAVDGLGGYTGSARNGVISQNWGSWQGSFTVAAAAAAVTAPTALTLPECPANYMDYRDAPVVLACSCLPGSAGGSVWGSRPYTDDSSVCTAAQHAGILDANGAGEVRVGPARPLASYPGSTANGVTSSSYGPWGYAFTVE